MSGRVFTFEINRTTSAPAATLFRLETDGAGWSKWAKPLIVQSSWVRRGDPAPAGIGAVRKVGLWPMLMREKTVAHEQDRRHLYRSSVRGNAQAGATFFWDSGAADIQGPDLLACLAPLTKSTPENVAKYGLPQNGWILFGSPTHPRSRGRLRLSGPDPRDPIRIEANALSDPHDVKTGIACIETLREIGNSAELRPFVKREVMPGDLTGDELETYLRNAVSTYWHESGTAKIGRDPMSVVDGHLRVYGVGGLRVADASIMPRITSGNTMAPCVVIGERAAQFIKAEHRL